VGSFRTQTFAASAGGPGLTSRFSGNRCAVPLNLGVRHVERVALSSYSKVVKAVILVGIPFFFLLGAMCVWLALTDAASIAAVAIFVTMTSGFVGIGWFGLRLLPFLHSSCAATPEGLHIFDRDLKETFIPWSSIARVKDWPTFQVLDIYSKDGKRVLSIDYYISNFEPLYRQVLERVPTNA